MQAQRLLPEEREGKAYRDGKHAVLINGRHAARAFRRARRRQSAGYSGNSPFCTRQLRALSSVLFCAGSSALGRPQPSYIALS